MPPAPTDPDDLLRHAGWIRRLALRLCADAHAADDAVQDTFAAALRRPPEDPERARGFLAATLRNTLAMTRRGDRRRARREARALPADAPVDDPSALVARAEMHQRLGELVLALPEPQRELVLRHYFHGEDVARLAQRLDTTPDAVRAHLRRARERLRWQLERGDDRTARTFAVLVAATQPDRIAVGTAAAATAAAGGLAITTMKTKLLLAAAAVVAVACLVVPGLVGPADGEVGSERPLLPREGGATRANAAIAAARTDSGDPTRTEIPAVAPATRRGQLVGRIPDAPWTAAIALEVQGRLEGDWHDHETEVPVAADGRFAIDLPSWAEVCDSFTLYIKADDPWYEPVYVRRRESVREETGPLLVPVTPIGLLVGEVTDEAGNPVPAARLCVFDPREDGEMTTVRARTNTAADGRYRLRVPAAAAELLLVALPMQEASLSGVRMMGSDGAILDCNAPREDLMPACTRVVTRFGGTTEAPPLRLPAPTDVTGRVVGPDGAPLPGVGVVWLPQEAARYVYVPRMNIGIWADDSVGWSARTTTDQDGRFRLPAAARKPGSCYLADAAGKAEPLVEPRSLTPPGEVVFRVHETTTLRVTRGGDAVRDVRVIVTGSTRDRLQRRMTDEHGELRFLRSAGEPCEITLEPPGDEPRRVELPAGQAGPVVVELPARPSATVRVEFDGRYMVRQVRMAWHRSEVKATPLTMERFRNPTDGPFVVELPLGRHQLTISPPQQAELRDTFLVPTTVEVEVTEGGTDVTVPVLHGGRVHVTAMDARGGLLSGFVSIRGQGGTRWRESMHHGAVESVNVPAGTYEVRVDLGSQGTHRRTVVVTPLEVADVRIVVP